MGKKEAILLRSSEVFFKFGLHKVSMDELAEQIGISKKTIYNNFGSKENLLEQIIFTSMNRLIDDLTNTLLSSELDLMKKFSNAVNLISNQYGKFDKVIKVDVNAERIISSPECVILNDQIKDAVAKIALEAKSHGYLRESINIDMLPYIFLNIIKGMTAWTQGDNIKFSKLDLMTHTIEIALNGILTPKGLLELNKS